MSIVTVESVETWVRACNVSVESVEGVTFRSSIVRVDRCRKCRRCNLPQQQQGPPGYYMARGGDPGSSRTGELERMHFTSDGGLEGVRFSQ